MLNRCQCCDLLNRRLSQTLWKTAWGDETAMTGSVKKKKKKSYWDVSDKSGKEYKSTPELVQFHDNINTNVSARSAWACITPVQAHSLSEHVLLLTELEEWSELLLGSDVWQLNQRIRETLQRKSCGLEYVALIVSAWAPYAVYFPVTFPDGCHISILTY